VVQFVALLVAVSLTLPAVAVALVCAAPVPVHEECMEASGSGGMQGVRLESGMSMACCWVTSVPNNERTILSPILAAAGAAAAQQTHLSLDIVVSMDRSFASDSSPPRRMALTLPQIGLLLI
jgi:hypothetical protein